MGALLIQVEGPDFSFKSTVSEELKTLIESKIKEKDPIFKGRENVIIAPAIMYNHESSYYIRNFVNGIYGDPSKEYGIDKALMYTMQRYDIAYNTYKDLFNNDKNILILDRWSLSNLFYQFDLLNGNIKEKYDLLEVISRLFDIEHNIFKIPVPDMIFFVHQDVERAISIILSDDKTRKRDKIESNIEYLRTTYERYYDKNAYYVAMKNYVDSYNIILRHITVEKDLKPQMSRFLNALRWRNELCLEK